MIRGLIPQPCPHQVCIGIAWAVLDTPLKSHLCSVPVTQVTLQRCQVVEMLTVLRFDFTGSREVLPGLLMQPQAMQQ